MKKFDYDYLTYIQQNLREGVTKHEANELLQWLDSRIFHNIVLKNCQNNEERSKINHAIDVQGLAYDEITEGNLPQTIKFSKIFRTSGYCTWTAKFAKQICRNLGLNVKILSKSAPWHIFSTVGVNSFGDEPPRKFIIDPTLGQFFDPTIRENQKSGFLHDIFTNGFIESTPKNQELYYEALGLDPINPVNITPYNFVGWVDVYNDLTPAEIYGMM